MESNQPEERETLNEPAARYYEKNVERALTVRIFGKIEYSANRGMAAYTGFTIKRKAYTKVHYVNQSLNK